MSAEDRMYKVYRPVAVKINDIWQSGQGVYVNLNTLPCTAKFILNGKEFIVNVDTHNFYDLDGYSDIDVEKVVIQLNINTLPPAHTRFPNPLTL